MGLVPESTAQGTTDVERRPNAQGPGQRPCPGVCGLAARANRSLDGGPGDESNVAVGNHAETCLHALDRCDCVQIVAPESAPIWSDLLLGSEPHMYLMDRANRPCSHLSSPLGPVIALQATKI